MSDSRLWLPTDTNRFADPLRRHVGRWEEAKEAFEPTRREMWRDLQVLRGDVFSAKEKEVFRQQEREVPNYPLALPMLNLVCGTEAQNRSDLKIYPVGPSDVDGARAVNQVLRKEVRSADLMRKLSEQFRHAGGCGLGWMRTGFSSYIDAPGPLAYEVPNPFDVWRDPASRDLGLEDCKDLFVRKYMTRGQLARLWPQHARHIYQLKGADASSIINLSHTSDYSNAYGDYPDVNDEDAWDGLYTGRDNRLKLIEAVERWYRIDRWVEVVRHRDGRWWEVTEKNIYDLAGLIVDGVAWEESGILRDIRYAVFAEDLMLGDYASPFSHRRFPLVPMWAYQDEYGNPMGLVRLVRTAVKDFNARMANLLNRALNRQVMVEENAVADLDTLAEELSYTDGMIVTKPGAIARGAIKFVDQLNASPLEGQLLQIAQKFPSDQAGVTEEMAGQSSNVDSGVGIQRKIQQGQTGLYTLFDNRSWTLRRVGELTLANIQDTYTQEQAIRVTESPKGIEWIFINKQDPTTGAKLNDIVQASFDVEVSEVPMSASDRMSQFEALTQFLAPMPTEVKLLFAAKMATLAEIPDAEEVAQKLEAFTSRVLGGGGAPPAIDPELIAQLVQEGQLTKDGANALLQQLQQASQGQPPGQPPAPQGPASPAGPSASAPQSPPAGPPAAA